jgi:hypothetical protein
MGSNQSAGQSCPSASHSFLQQQKSVELVAKNALRLRQVVKPLHFVASLPKGVKNRTSTPDPRNFTKMSPILMQTP